MTSKMMMQKMIPQSEYAIDINIGN